MANKIFGSITISGGSNGALDTIKEASLTDGDIAIVADSNEEALFYRYESSSTAAEDSPQAIRPDDYGSAGVWILTDISAEDLKIYGDAVIDGTLTMTGLLTATAGIDIDGYLRFDGAGVEIVAVLDEDAMGSDSAVSIATQQSIKAYVDAQVAGVTMDSMTGYFVRPAFRWKDADEIYVGECRMHHNGTTEQILKADAELTFQFGSGGSNASSDDIDDAALTLHYLYIDDSALAGATLTAARLYNSITGPVWDADQLGWYGVGGGGVDNTETEDKCIGAFWANAADELEEFSHDGGELMLYASTAKFTDYDATYPGTDYSATATLNIPSFCTAGYVFVRPYPDGEVNYSEIYVRPTGSTATIGQIVGAMAESPSRTKVMGGAVKIGCSTGQSIDIKSTVGDGNGKLTLVTIGYYFPKGM